MSEKRNPKEIIMALEEWKEFVGKAIVHNFSEIQRVFITNGLAEMKVE